MERHSFVSFNMNQLTIEANVGKLRLQKCIFRYFFSDWSTHWIIYSDFIFYYNRKVFWINFYLHFERNIFFPFDHIFVDISIWQKRWHGWVAFKFKLCCEFDYVWINWNRKTFQHLCGQYEWNRLKDLHLDASFKACSIWIIDFC